MADLKTSDENTLTKSGFTANTVMRLADGSTSDNYKTPVLDFINAITLTSAQAVTLLGTPSDVVLDSLYKITTLGITSVDHVIISGRNMIQGNSSAECLVTGIGYVPCTYDVATNKLSYSLYADLLVSQSGSSATTVVVAKNDFGGTFSSDYNNMGDYKLTPSVDLTTLGNAIYLIGGITFDETGTRFTTAKWDSGIIRLYSFRNNIASVDRTDEIFLDTPIRLIVTFSN